MPAQKGRPYRNFTLVQLDHLYEQDKAEGPLAIKILNERLKEGKKLIDRLTKPGDLVLIETPEKYTLRTLKKTFGKNFDKKLWESLEKLSFNFYYELAQYAERNGRLVDSVDTGTVSPGSRLERLVNEIAEHSITDAKGLRATKRIKFLAYYRRSILMCRRIQRKKPKLVIVASGHATYIESKMKPKKTVWTSPYWNNPEGKKYYLETMEQEKQYYLGLKKLRRKAIANYKGLPVKKGWKPKI